MTDRIPVSVTKHAVARARERCPELRDQDLGQTRGFLNWEVREAIANSRVACRCPRWIKQRGGQRERAGRHLGDRGRYAWNADDTRCFLIVRENWPNRQPIWVLVTVYARAQPKAAAA